ncbi:MAG TPA: hypothetical protein PLS03_00410 [Terrimicrobiaceae bacterium]|nr:hypothetical protein [Terrimicrobiaceae bacterium]
MKPATRLLLWLAGWAALLMIVAALAVMIAVTQSRRALEATRSELAERGEKLSVAALAPPARPGTGNGAEALTEASREIAEIAKAREIPRVTIGQKESDPGFAEVLHRRHAAVRRQDDVPWQDVAAGLQPMRDALEKLHTAAAAPALEAQPDFSRGFTMPMDSVGNLLTGAQHLSISGLVLLQEGRTSEAAEAIVTLIRMSGLPARQPVLISQLVAASILGLAQVNTWEALQSGMSGQDLARLQSAWEQSRKIDSIPKALRMERAMAAAMFDEYSRTMGISSMTAAPASSLPASLSELASMAGFGAWKFIFRYSDERQFLLNYQDLLDTLPPQPGGSWRPVLEKAADIETALTGAGIGRMFSSTLVPTLRSSLHRFAMIDTARNLTIAALAIRRYQIDHGGALPAALEALVPEYLSAVPQDPLAGRPLRYQVLDPDGFLLYSAGLDGIDNGGDASPAGRTHSFLDRKDIVWPRPASEKKRPQEEPANAVP